jgi:hypothetical protein
MKLKYNTVINKLNRKLAAITINRKHLKAFRKDYIKLDYVTRVSHRQFNILWEGVK